MIRLRVSTLEAFRRVAESDFGDEPGLVETLVRGQWVEGPSNWIMDPGTEWHALLADPLALSGPVAPDDRLGDKYLFSAEAVDQSKVYVGPGLCEVPGRRVWRLGSWEYVSVEGTTDHIHGLVLQDHKTKFSAADPKDYEPSLQWRFYLAIHGAACLRYNLFSFRDPKEDGYCELKDVMSFRFWPYSGLEQDCRAWLLRFLEWAHMKKLVPYLCEHKEAA